MSMKKYFLILFFLIGVMQLASSQDKKTGYDFNRAIKKIRDSTSCLVLIKATKNSKCLMRAGHGTIKQVDQEETFFCENCKKLADAYNK
jgi:predicted Zn-dependent protease